MKLMHLKLELELIQQQLERLELELAISYQPLEGELKLKQLELGL
jgi:hypothetical protein